jgi:hypothetical protein
VGGVKEEVPCRRLVLQLDQQQHQFYFVFSGKGRLETKGCPKVGNVLEPTSVVTCSRWVVEEYLEPVNEVDVDCSIRWIVERIVDMQSGMKGEIIRQLLAQNISACPLLKAGQVLV